MTEYEVTAIDVKLSEEDQAHSRIFSDRSTLHARVNSEEWGAIGEVFISDGETHRVAKTDGVNFALRSGLLVQVGDEAEQAVDLEEIDITRTAQETIEDLELDATKIQPTGHGGTQITKADVDRYVKSLDS